jgi:hypothetical protein
MVMRLTWTGQPPPISHVVLASNRVSPGQTGSAAEIVGLMSQSCGECMQNPSKLLEASSNVARRWQFNKEPPGSRGV